MDEAAHLEVGAVLVEDGPRAARCFVRATPAMSRDEASLLLGGPLFRGGWVLQYGPGSYLQTTSPLNERTAVPRDDWTSEERVRQVVLLGRDQITWRIKADYETLAEYERLADGDYDEALVLAIARVECDSQHWDHLDRWEELGRYVDRLRSERDAAVAAVVRLRAALDGSDG